MARLLAAPTTSGTIEQTTTSMTSTTSTTMPDPTADWTRCENPDGFSLSYPQDWSTNAGAVVGECSQFDPEPFTVPAGTDERVVAITAFVDPVAYAEVAAPGDEVDRAVTTVDGHQALRIEAAGSEFFGEDTAATRYLIDLSADANAEPRTLFLDTIELSGMAYEENVEILDRMVRTIEIDGASTGDTGAESEDVVARYGGGGTPFAAGGELQGTEPCLTVPLDGDPETTCFSAPGPESIRIADLSGELLDVVGGVAGSEVFRVDAELASGTMSYLPVPIGGSDVAGWILPLDPGEPVGSFEPPPASSGDFPATGPPPAYLTDVRMATHDGFDRVVFEFEPGEDFAYEIQSADEVRATSGQVVEVEGEAILRVTMNPASGVDLMGDEPEQTYTGPARLGAPGTDAVTEVVLVEDFENVSTWAVGTGTERPIATEVLSDPLRLVIDVETADGPTA